eukprot:GAHX01001934.1.p1 GENE.GAHX01001934.1~~GAHX01001934.1.p1  ORF type:complete len:688 (+),score=102.56 GAHX01001934.1:150-2213(+)
MEYKHSFRLQLPKPKTRESTKGELFNTNLLQPIDVKKIRITSFHKFLFQVPKKSLSLTKLTEPNLLIKLPSNPECAYKFMSIPTILPKKRNTLFTPKYINNIKNEILSYSKTTLEHHDHFIHPFQHPKHHIKQVYRIRAIPKLIKRKHLISFEPKLIRPDTYPFLHRLIDKPTTIKEDSFLINEQHLKRTFNYTKPQFNISTIHLNINLFKLKFVSTLRSVVYLNKDIKQYFGWLRKPVYVGRSVPKIEMTNQCRPGLRMRIFKCLFKPLFNIPQHKELGTYSWNLKVFNSTPIPCIDFGSIFEVIENQRNEFFVSNDDTGTIRFITGSQIETDCYHVLIGELSNIRTINAEIKEKGNKFWIGVQDICTFLDTFLTTCIRAIIYRGLITLFAISTSFRPFMAKLQHLLKAVNKKNKLPEIKDLLSIVKNTNFIRKVISMTFNTSLLDRQTLFPEEINYLKEHDSHLLYVPFAQETKPISIEQLITINRKIAEGTGKSVRLFMKRRNTECGLEGIPIFSEYKERGIIVGVGEDLDQCVLVVNTQIIVNNKALIETLASYIIKESIKYTHILVVFVLENTTETIIETIVGCKEFFLLTGLGLSCTVAFDMVLDCDVYEKEEPENNQKERFYNATGLFNKEQISFLTNRLSTQKMFETTMEDHSPQLEGYKITNEQLQLFKYLITKEIKQ